MFRPLALTLLFALLTSIVVALLTVVPPLVATILLKQEPEREFGFVRRFHARLPAACSRRALRRPRTHARHRRGGACRRRAALVPLLGTDFMPPLDEGSIAINVVRLPNASLDGSVAVGDA